MDNTEDLQEQLNNYKYKYDYLRCVSTCQAKAMRKRIVALEETIKRLSNDQ